MASAPTTRRKRRKESAGLLVYRGGGNDPLEVLLGHPGGPFWMRRDEGAWSIPKGELEDGEEPLAAAQREFREETSFEATGPFIELGSVRQPGGKLVHAWAVRGDFDAKAISSIIFVMEWPPRSGRLESFPEIDRADWFGLGEARRKILTGQAPLLDRLEAALGTR